MQPTRPALAESLDLEPHPEGGWFRETWRSGVTFEPAGYGSARASSTAIYFLLGPGERSRWHRVRSTELWLWHAGGPLELRLGGTGPRPESRPELLVLGPDVTAGQQPQAVVPAGAWQAARPTGDDYVLVTCVVSPGFDFADFELAWDARLPTARCERGLTAGAQLIHGFVRGAPAILGP